MNEKFKKLNLSLIIAIVAMIVYDIFAIIANTIAISNVNDQLKRNQSLMAKVDVDTVKHLLNNTQIYVWFIVATIVILVIALIITIINRAKANKSLQLIIIGLLAIVAVLFIVGLAFGGPLLGLVSLLLLIPAYRGYKELNSAQSVVQQIQIQQ